MVRKSKSFRAGVIFPVARFKRYLKQSQPAFRISDSSAIYMSSVIEYLVAEIIELSGNAAKDNKKVRIIPRHIQLAVKHDHELGKLFENVTIAQGGVLPSIHSALLPQKSKQKDLESQDF
ncbi:hypothetical protein BB561_003155 [Smittium simulii]|uniref:Histone H2A n=1 Tax=Smittium simulii TaxID=133385 RepID=A0A2T9YML5_9FUNG|nr:hypothetical protein BB561_003155 [Smittium simulii]